MNLNQLFMIGIVSALASTVVLAQQSLPMRITVKKASTTDRTTIQKGRTESSGCRTTHFPKVTDKTEEVTLDINLMLTGGKEAKDLKVVYYVVGRDRQSKTLSLTTQGEKTVNLAPTKTVTVSTDSISYGSRDAKFVTGLSGARDRKSGTEYYGVAVKVFQSGTAPVATYYEPTELDTKLDKLLNPPASKDKK
jgi:hypothetical protein